jgi:hypothetical protein
MTSKAWNNRPMTSKYYLAARCVKFLDKRAIETNNDTYLNDLLNKLCAVKTLKHNKTQICQKMGPRWILRINLFKPTNPKDELV